MPASRERVVICGAAGRDFHNFNVVYRDDPAKEVVAFTATQIPGIDQRTYPAELAGPLYPHGIPIVAEASLEALCKQRAVNQVVFAYSDVSHAHVMQLASTALAARADFSLLGPRSTMLESTVPVIAVCAVRTGCGKSQIARYLSTQLAGRGYRVAALRHPMPYGDLAKQSVQRFATTADLDAAQCTVEEREEYEPYVATGSVIFAGVDYAAILERAQTEAEVILWDGGNNDFSFVRPGLTISVVDALRPDQLDTHHPGTAVLKMADIVVVNKVHAATETQRTKVAAELDRLVPDTPRVIAASPVTLDHPELVQGRRVLIVEDGPTITHGGMPYGAGYHAVQKLETTEIVDPRASAVPEIASVFERFPHIGPVLPAMGYGKTQLEALAATINAAKADVVVAGTPIDLKRLLALQIPVVRARYDYQDVGERDLMSHVSEFLAEHSV